MPAVPPRLGEILVKRAACSEDAVRSALRNQIIFGGRLGTNLLEIQGVAEDALAGALGSQHAVPALSGNLALAPRATALLTSDVADRCDAIPYALADRRLALLVVDPRNLAMLDEVAFATGKQVHPIVVPEARVWALLRSTYGVERNLRGIDVDFATIGAGGARTERETPSTAVSGRSAGSGAEDLIGEGEFTALYGRTLTAPREPAGVPPPAPRVVVSQPLVPPAAASPRRVAPADAIDGEVIELTDLLEPDGALPTAGAPAPLAAEVLDALARRPGHAPPPTLAAGGRPPVAPEPEPSPLSFAEAVRFLEGVAERNAIAGTVLRYARSKFRRAVLLTVQGGAAHGWAGLGETLGAGAVRRMHLALGSPGILDIVVRTQAHFLGPIPKTEANIRLLKALGGGVPANAFVVPILALGKVVNLFYADNGKGGVVDSADVGELLILATRIAKSYDALVSRVG